MDNSPRDLDDVKVSSAPLRKCSGSDENVVGGRMMMQSVLCVYYLVEI